MRKWKHQNVKQLSGDHPAKEWQNQERPSGFTDPLINHYAKVSQGLYL